MSRLIIFDVDSTLLAVESLDFAVEQALASAADGPARTARLKALTDQGMAGTLDFRASLDQRLAIASLTRPHVAQARTALCEQITPGMADLVEALQARGDTVAAVSGGFLDLIGAALTRLGLEAGDIRANRFVFDEHRVVGFDRGNPLSRSGGKGPVVASLKALTGAQKAIMVGDGMTDFEAFVSGAADAFVGFGGVAVRAPVKAQAPVYADTVAALRALLMD